MLSIWRPAAAVVLAALACTLALAAMARPDVGPDQNGSWMLGHEIVEAAVDAAKRAIGVGEPAAVRTPEQIAADYDFHAWAANRSPAYSLFFYAAQRGTLWFLTFAQALAAAAFVYALWRAAAPKAPLWSYGALMGFLSLATALPFMAGYGNADLFAACAIIAAILVMLCFECYGIAAKGVLFALLAFFAATHAATGLIVMAVALAGAIVLWRFGREPRNIGMRGAFVLAACLVGALIDPLYGAVYHASTGGSFSKPPFLMARVLADGPGREYLREACDGGADYAMCAYRNLPLDDSDDILWSDDPARGVYRLQDAAGRERILADQPRILVGVITHKPLEAVAAALGNSWRQLLQFNVDPMLQNQYRWMDAQHSGTFMQDATIRAGGCVSEAACAPRANADLLRLIHYAVAAAAFAATLYFCFLLWRQRGDGAPGSAEEDVVIAVSMLLLLGVAANAAVCGALSGVFSRYQARVVWLLPVAALLPAWRLYGARLLQAPAQKG